MEELYTGILKVVLFLIGTIGLFAVIKNRGLTFFLGGENKKENGSLKRLDTVHLGYRKFVSVVEVKDRILVLGVTDKEIRLLAKWRKEEKE